MLSNLSSVALASTKGILQQIKQILHFFVRQASLTTCWMIDPFFFLTYWFLKFMKYSLTCTLGCANLAFWWPTCFCKPSNLEINNVSQHSTTMQILHLTIFNLQFSLTIAFAHGNFVAQTSWNVQFNFHESFFQALSREGACTWNFHKAIFYSSTWI